MSYRILTKNGVDNTNIDAARAEFFNSGMRDGIVRGAFTEGTFSSNASNSVYLDSCELRISGHRVVIDEPVYKTFSNTPASNMRYSMIAQISVDSVSVVTFSIIIQDANTELRKDNLYATETGTGIYQIEIGRFTLTTSGTIIDIVRTADLITGGGEDENTYIEIGEVTTTTLDEGIDAEVDVENVIDEQTGKKKTNFHFGIPSASGTVVNINGQHQETVNFDSEPQSQINELKTTNSTQGKDIDELKSTNSTQGKDIDDLKNETLKKPASAPAKRKIVGIGTNNSQELIDIDEDLSENSENPVQNKVVTKKLANKAELDASNLTDENVESWQKELGIIKFERLWYNRNPNASFSAQTVNLSSSDWDYLIITSRNNDSQQRTQAAIFSKSSPNSIGTTLNYVSSSSSYGPLVFVRHCNIVSYNGNPATSYAQVYFENCYEGYNSTEVLDNRACIPNEIIGIKVVK